MKYLYKIVSLIILVGCSKQPADQVIPTAINEINLISTDKQFIAGDEITLEFSNSIANTYYLKFKNGWGSSIIKPTKDNALKFKIPEALAQKSGSITWSLFNQQEIVLNGSLEILPSNIKAQVMETYLGPTSLFADGKDQSMFVALPQDRFGNPLAEGTSIKYNTQLNKSLEEHTIVSENNIAFTYLNSGTKVGDLFLSVRNKNQISKEFSIAILPTKAADFKIYAEQKHPFADGNQIISFTTDAIKDINKNLIADGTLVKFLIKKEDGTLLTTNGQTINGQAIGKLLHPELPQDWQVQAFINGAAKSNQLKISFKNAVRDFKITLSADKKSIRIGPIESYMHQLIPDGMGVALKIKDKDNRIIHTQNANTRKGMASFKIPISTQTIVVSIGGITKMIRLNK